MKDKNNYLTDRSYGHYGGHFLIDFIDLFNRHCLYFIHNIHDCLLGDVRPYHHACAVQQRRHHLTACVKASGEHFERS